MNLWAFRPALTNEIGKVVAHLELDDDDLTKLAAGERLAADYASEGFGLVVFVKEDQ
jgi:hypothetical protein